MNPVVVGAAVGALALIVASIILLRRAEEDPLTNRIEEYAVREEAVSIEEIELSMPITDRLFVPLLRRMSDLVIRLTPQTMLERTAHKLELAGSPGNISAAEFWTIRAGSAVNKRCMTKDKGRQVLMGLKVGDQPIYFCRRKPEVIAVCIIINIVRLVVAVQNNEMVLIVFIE